MQSFLRLANEHMNARVSDATIAQADKLLSAEPGPIANRRRDLNLATQNVGAASARYHAALERMAMIQDQLKLASRHDPQYPSLAAEFEVARAEVLAAEDDLTDARRYQTMTQTALMEMESKKFL
ncbi:hypothetical protein ABZ914_03995 [Spirillospora sp. NPDC046719]